MSLDLEIKAGLALLEFAIDDGTGTFSEQEKMPTAIWYTTKKGGMAHVQVTNYLLGKSYALENKWIVASGNTYTVTTAGKKAHEDNKENKFRPPAKAIPVTTHERWIKELLNRPVIAGLAILGALLLLFISNYANVKAILIDVQKLLSQSATTNTTSTRSTTPASSTTPTLTTTPAPSTGKK